MNRFAKKFRVFAGICAILNLVAVFLPVTREIRENYADVTYHQFDYIQSALAKFLPFLESGKVQVTAGQAGLILLVMLLPMILAVAAFVWAIAGGHGQKGSSILIFLVFFGYIVMALSIGQFWPDEANGVSYARGIGSILPVIFSGAGAIFSVLALIATPGKVKIASEGIPEVEMFKQQKIDAQYNIIEQQEPEKPKEEQQDLPPHGVIVGIKGLYAGANIPITDGEPVRMGRALDNHLIFEGQPRISRRHCEIRWDGERQKYIIRDYSSMGTFLKGSEDCLPQNLDLVLEPGSEISLGDDENNIFYLK